ncbi:remorin-like [Nymphaea colorata]|nr:remorin-like [Nymphaea colorata]
MEGLVQQLRVTFSGIGEESQEPVNRRGRQISIRKGQSFREKKEGVNVFGWQIPGLKGVPLGYEPSRDGQFETAVAASAYAIKMVEEPDGFSQRRSGEGMDSRFKLSRRREEGAASPSQLGDMSRRLSWKSSKEDKQYRGEASSKTPEITVDGPKPGRTPTMGRIPTSTEKRKVSNGSGTVRPASRPTNYVAPRLPNKLASNNNEMKAAAWEIAKLAAIQQRYEESVKAIEAWEKKRQRRAKSRLERKQEELERKIAIATGEYRDEMKSVNKIAGGARSQAEEKRRNEEMKVKERARRIRLTGEAPQTCFCF